MRKKSTTRVRKTSNGSTMSVAITEDDGTQVERVTKKTRRPKKTSAAGDPAVLKNELKEFCLATSKAGVTGIMEEFTQIRTQTQAIGNKPKVAFDAHKEKNRYKDVFCIDSTRVQLTFPPGADDYIHANWVNGSDGSKKFICTQGPKDNTIEDFWRMVWQEKCKSIVMLCNEEECGKKKCEKYWPDSANPSLSYPCNLTVKYIKTEELESHLILTKVEVQDEAGTRLTVDHIQWRDWPDRGVPVTSMSVFRLLSRVNKCLPSVVHCSAGIGRTGTVVGIDLFYSKLEKGEKTTLGQVVRDLRNVRHGSVQTDVQFAYMHRIIMAVAENKRAVTAAEIEKFVADYDAMCKAKGC